MKIYKVKLQYKILLFVLSLSSVAFGLSHLFINGNNAKFIALIFMSVFIIFSFFTLSFKKVYFENNILFVRSLLGLKKINLTELCEASVINLKGRLTCVLSDKDNFAFLSSTIEDFMEIIEKIIKIAPKDMTEKLREIQESEIKKKDIAFLLFLIAANIFLIVIAIYNIL